MPMKYAIVIPDGAADEPQESLGGKTPLQAAETPEMDRIAREGRARPVAERPRPLPARQRRGHAQPLRLRPRDVLHRPGPARSRRDGAPLGPDDWAIRCNLMYIEDGRLTDFTAGHITSEEGRPLIEASRPHSGRHPRSSSIPGSATAT